ncbi:MAG: 16S rRNA (cytosine(967)-C(5))-methyltransferase RsmB, partial [Candidatus Thiodiazotropha sp. 6PLUC3]
MGRRKRPTKWSPRSISAKVIQGVLAGQSLSELIPNHLARLDDPRDGGLVQEIAYGVMRNYPRLEALVKCLLERPLKNKDRDVHALILIGLYQLLYLRVADHAAVHETADAAKQLGKPWAVGLINGVLRNFQRRRVSLLNQVDGEAEVKYAMPKWLLTGLEKQWPESWQDRAKALNSRPPMSLRVNLTANSREDYQQLLQSEGIKSVRISHAPAGLTLESPLDVEQLPGFQKGWVSVQDGAAQLAAELLDLNAGQQVLDACAAPGGKSCHLLEREPGLKLTAVDLSAERLQRVEENLARLNLQAEVAVGDASKPQGAWANRHYDRILLDVPCSATGVLRRHPDIKLLRRASDINNLVQLQGEILKAIWPLLAVGGKMLYVTCSILAEENERQLQHFFSEQPDAGEHLMDVSWG